LYPPRDPRRNTLIFKQMHDPFDHKIRANTYKITIKCRRRRPTSLNPTIREGASSRPWWGHQHQLRLHRRCCTKQTKP
ncbi:MAG: hypothetical protein K2G08_07140, partial [Paramuribaculum sp.]|nr:hypothetical protein [Paramuribaculum sp.]